MYSTDGLEMWDLLSCLKTYFLWRPSRSRLFRAISGLEQADPKGPFCCGPNHENFPESSRAPFRALQKSVMHLCMNMCMYDTIYVPLTLISLIYIVLADCCVLC